MCVSLKIQLALNQDFYLDPKQFLSIIAVKSIHTAYTFLWQLEPYLNQTKQIKMFYEVSVIQV